MVGVVGVVVVVEMVVLLPSEETREDTAKQIKDKRQRQPYLTLPYLTLHLTPTPYITLYLKRYNDRWGTKTI